MRHYSIATTVCSIKAYTLSVQHSGHSVTTNNRQTRAKKFDAKLFQVSIQTGSQVPELVNKIPDMTARMLILCRSLVMRRHMAKRFAMGQPTQEVCDEIQTLESGVTAVCERNCHLRDRGGSELPLDSGRGFRAVVSQLDAGSDTWLVVAAGIHCVPMPVLRRANWVYFMGLSKGEQRHLRRQLTRDCPVFELQLAENVTQQRLGCCG